ncbi:hypothetical protein QFC21_007331, partial [Naganishia friedmannii]
PKGAATFQKEFQVAEEGYDEQRVSRGVDAFYKVKKPRTTKVAKTAMITGVRVQTNKALQLKEGASKDVCE